MSNAVPLRKKNISSLLLVSFLPDADFRDFVHSYERVTEHVTHDRPIPDAEVVELVQEGRKKWMIDFSSEIDLAQDYHDSLTAFLTLREPFLYSVIAIDKRFSFALSAIINVAFDLAVFELKIPRIPRRLVEADNFEFDYLVWHPRSEP